MALDPPQSVVKEIDKCRAFLCKGSQNVSGGNCLVAWSVVCHPIQLGGLGVHNLSVLGQAMRICWQWLQRTWDARPWGRLQFQTNREEHDLFQASIMVKVGNRENALFWEDRWLNGCSIPGFDPSIVQMVTPSIRRKRTVAQALTNDNWILDIQGQPGANLLRRFCGWGICCNKFVYLRIMSIQYAGVGNPRVTTLLSRHTGLSSQVR